MNGPITSGLKMLLIEMSKVTSSNCSEWMVTIHSSFGELMARLIEPIALRTMVKANSERDTSQG